MSSLEVFPAPQAHPVSLAAGLIFLFLSWGIYRICQIGKRDKRLPPGPPTLPLIGNLHQVPLTGIHKKFKEWGEQYGGVYSLKFGPGTMIVLFDRKAINQLLDKKGAVYSERPRNYVANLITHGDSFAFMDSTPLWRSQRKVAAHNLSPRVLDESVGKIQDAEVTICMEDLLDTPQDFYHHIQRTTASVAGSVVWGHRGPTYDNFWGHAVYKALDQYSIALEPGANPPVDEFPFLKYIPERFAYWKRRAKQSYTGMDNVWKEARRQVDARRAKGIKRPSIVDKMLDGAEKESDIKLTDNQLNHFLGVLVEGGSDTTASSILTSILFLTMNPQFQRKAQEELDRVCGPDRMPNFSDFNELPYINCIVKEAMRIHPVLPVGVPHRVNKDDYYEGMLIPKDASIVIPVWAMHFSEKTGFKDPEKYNPDRFLDFPKLANDYAGSGNFEGRDHYGYGAGRRICPGIHLAERTQFRMTARLLWAFDILREIDPKTGKPFDIDTEAYNEGLNHVPSPFRAVFKPRSQAHIDTIRKEAARAREFVKIYE